MARRDRTTEMSRLQWVAAQAGWMAVVAALGTLLYWLYLSSMAEPRNWIVNAGLGASVGLTVLFLYGMGAAIVAAVRSPEGRSSLRSAALIAAVLAAIGIANVIAYRRHVQWDITGNRRLTLAPMTQRVLKGLKQPITATAYYTRSAQKPTEARQAREVRDLLEQYADRSPSFRFSVVDYLREPDKFISAQAGGMPPMVVFTNAAGGREEVKGTTEKDFTGAVLKLSRTERRTVAFTTGHGELNPESYEQDAASLVRQALAEQQHTVTTLDLMGRARAVPKGIDVLVIAGPRIDFKPDEVKAVNAYLASGGRVLLLLRVGGPALPGITAPLGLRAGDNVVAQLVDYAGMLAVSKEVNVRKFEAHDVNRGLANVTFPLARTLDIAVPAPKGVVVTPIIRSGPETLTKPLKPGQRSIDLRPADADKKGPFNLAVVAENAATGKGRLLVVGSTEFADDMMAGEPTSSNRYLFTNAVNWLAEDDALVDIPPRDEKPDELYLKPEETVKVVIFNLLLPPLACLLMAGYSWWKRR